MELRSKPLQHLVKHFKFIWIIALVLFSCQDPEKRALNSPVIKPEGKYDDNGLEAGNWKYFDKENGKLLEEGSFSKGIRIGQWRYYSPFDINIDWTEFVSADSVIRTNVPKLLKVVESDSSITKFSHQEPSTLLNLVIGRGFVSDTTNFTDYRNLMFAELRGRHIELIDSLSKLVTVKNGRQFMYLYFLAKNGNEQPFSFFNISGKDQTGKIVEISLRCEPEYVEMSRKIFFSVIPNIFIDNQRFLPLNEEVLAP